MTESPPTTTERLLNYFGNQIPEDIAVAARRTNIGRRGKDGYPNTLAELQPSDGHRVRDGVVEFINPTPKGDGVIVRHRQSSDDEYEYWATTDDQVVPCVTQLVSKTSLVAVDGEDDYLPGADDDDDVAFEENPNTHTGAIRAEDVQP